MNNKTKIMWILNIPIWICCLAAITVRPYSKVAWGILTAIEWLFVLGVLIILILGVIELKKEEKKLNKQIEEANERFKEWLENLLKDDEQQGEDLGVNPNEVREAFDLPPINLENKEDKEG